MALLTRYNDFIDCVNELGFLALSQVLPGLPSLGEYTRADAWHTGDAASDPWQWKDRAADEKKLAYGCILNGHKGFVAPRMYAVFYAAYHPTAAMPDRWEAGEVNQTVWQLWQVFEQKTLLNTADVRREMGVTAKSGGSRVDAALQQLQREYHLTVAGVRQKTAKDGSLYGWPASVYDRALDWAPPAWMQSVPDQATARAAILDRAAQIAPSVDRSALEKALSLQPTANS